MNDKEGSLKGNNFLITFSEAKAKEREKEKKRWETESDRERAWWRNIKIKQPSSLPQGSVSGSDGSGAGRVGGQRICFPKEWPDDPITLRLPGDRPEHIRWTNSSLHPANNPSTQRTLTHKQTAQSTPTCKGASTPPPLSLMGALMNIQCSITMSHSLKHYSQPNIAISQPLIINSYTTWYKTVSLSSLLFVYNVVYFFTLIINSYTTECFSLSHPKFMHKVA